VALESPFYRVVVMKPGSDEWFRAESEKAAARYHVEVDSGSLESIIESALRRVWNLACGECWKECQGTKSGLGRDGWPAPLEAYEIAAAISAKQVKP